MCDNVFLFDKTMQRTFYFIVKGNQGKLPIRNKPSEIERIMRDKT